MKPLYYRILTVLLFFSAYTHAQQLQVTPATIANDQVTRRVWSSTSSGSLGKTSSCNVDTIGYTSYKTSAFQALAMNNTTSGNTFAQWYPAPQTLTISGFDFYAWQSLGTSAVVPITCRIYNASIIDSLPTGAALATVVVNVDSTFGTGLLSTLRKRAIFATPVTVTGPYVITVENQSGNTVSVISNNWTVANGRSEWLSSVKIGTNFIRSYAINVGGTIFNADFILQPYVTYSLTSDFTSSPLCNQGGNQMTFTNTSSAVNFSAFYNTRAYFNNVLFSFIWDYGDTSGTFYSLNGTRSYNHRVAYNVSLKDSIWGYATGCADTRSKSIDASPPVPNATNNGPLCQGANLQLSADSIGGATYYWTGPNGFTSTLRRPTISGITILNQGTYNVTAIMGQCSSMVSSTVLNIIATPSAQSNSPLCAGQTLALTGTAIAGATYSWSGPNGFTSTISNPTKSNVQVTDSGTYSFTMTVAGCGTIGPYTTYVSVNPVPATPTVGNNGPLCVGDNLNLTASNVSGGSFTWTGPNGFSATQQNPSRPNVIPSFAGTYTVTVTANGCASVPASTTVSINNIPASPTAGNNGPLCAGQTLSLTATTITGATYLWSGPNNFTSGSQNPTRSSVTTTDAGTYSVVATLNGCSSPAATTTVAITTSTPTPVAGSNGPLCPGQGLQLTASNVTGATYSWSGPNGFTSTVQNPLIPSVTNAEAGLYSVTANTAGCGISSPGTVTVQINALPAPPTVGNNGPLCDGQTLNLTASTVTGGVYSWSGPNGFTSSAQNPSITSMNSIKAGNYNVTVAVSGCGTSAAATTNVIVRRVPSTPTALSNGPVCSGDSLKLNVTNIGGGASRTFTWIGPGSFSSTLQSPDMANVNSSNAGLYTVTVSDSGCTSNAGSVNVTVKSLPAAPVATNGGTICEGSNLFLYATSVSGASYKWTGPNAYSSGSKDPIIVAATAAATGTYSVQSVVNGCSSSPASTTVLVNPRPASPTAGNNGPKCVGDNVSLSASTVSGASYSWSGPNGYSSSQQNPVLTSTTLAMSGTYSVYVLISGCLSNPSTTDVVISTPPNAPTLSSLPNGSACSGDSIQLFASFLSGATYEWSGPAGYSALVQNPIIRNITSANTGQYTAIVNKGGCTSPPGNLTISVNDKPNTSSISGPDTVRNQEIKSYQVTGSGGSVFAWAVTGGTIQSGGISNTITVKWGAAGNGTVKVTETSSAGCNGTQKTMNVRVNSTVGIGEQQKQMSMRVYPNPASKELFVELNLKQKRDIKINILNLVGQLVDSYSSSDGSGVSKHTLDVEHLKAGIYFIQIIAGDEMITQKITVQ